MAKLTKKTRDAKPLKDFAGGGPKGKRGFYMGDASHARAAISGATHSYDAGNISKSKEESIKAEARKKLGIKPKESRSDRNARLDKWARSKR